MKSTTVHDPALFTYREKRIIMNMTTQDLQPDLPQQALDTLQRALDALHKTTGLQARIVAEKIPGDLAYRTDAFVEIDDPDGHAHRYAAQIKPIDRLAAVGVIKQRFYGAPGGAPGLLVAPRITPETADHCRTLQVPFIDTAGNTYLHAPGMFVFVKGQRFQRDDTTAGDNTQKGKFIVRITRPTQTPTGQRIIFALLCQPNKLLNAPYRDIVQTAGVALGAIGDVFANLEKRGIIAEHQRKGRVIINPKKGEITVERPPKEQADHQRAKQRRFLEPRRLLDEWVTNYPTGLRPKLNPKRFRAPDPNWWQNANIAQHGALWGAEVAADKLTHYLKPATCTLYVRPKNGRNNITQIVVENRLRADPQGNIEILDAFWDFPADPNYPDVVPPILAYADLVATNDPRNLETAKLLREGHIDHVIAPT